MKQLMKLIIIQSYQAMQLLISFYLLATALCGRILKGDIWVDYANAGSMTEISFSFMLSNAINQWDYIKVALPFPLHSSLVPAYPATEGLSLPSGLTVTYQYVDGSSNIQPAVYTCQVLTETIDSSNYFIRFYSTDRKTWIPIPKNQWFYLKFKIQQTDPLQYQKSSSILQVQLSTVSSVWTNAMVYDDNLAFNYFELAAAPTQTITLAATPYAFGNAGGYLLTQAVYSLYLDVVMTIPSYQFQENLKLIFYISQQSTFLWNGSCASVAKTNAPVIALLDPTLYTCSVDPVNNLMIVILTPAALAIQTSYRFTVGVQNPPVVVKNVDITVRAVKEVSGVILSYGIATAALNTNQIYITYQEIFVGWGLRPDALLPFDARVFRGNSATPTYMPYNSLSTKFKISQTTASTVELRIEISIPSETAAFVLANGFTHNLPSFPNKDARCVVEYATDTVKRVIACTGVGSLTASTVYYIGWKMFFPFDNYESDIDCTKFGLLTVYTAQTITAKDNLFILGRGNSFLKYLKSSPDYYVIGRNASYISYMKTFANLNMMVLSSDFQEFLKTPEQVIVTNRPDTYPNKQFNDVYLIGQNLAFMTYLQLFPDLYIAYRLKSPSDITKGYLSIPLVATSMPKNTLAIKTCNSKDWSGYSLNTNSIISTSTTAGATTTAEGIKISGSSQSLIFSMQALYSEITSVPSTDLVITNNWGMLIMLNPKIKLNAGSVTLTESAASLTATAVTIDSASSYNKYTLITLKGSSPSALQTSFKTVATKTVFSLFPFLISDFSSISADDKNFDIMIATVDGIDGPLNRMTFNGYFLINGFTMMNSAAINTINSGYVGYAHTTQMDGSKVPTMLRVKGVLPATPNFYQLCIFFDVLTPFFSNLHNGDVYCQTTDPISKCKYVMGAETSMTSYDYLNYQTMSRFEIKLADPTVAFNILIPVKAAQGKVQTYFYLGYTTKDPTTGAVSIQYMSPRKIVTHSGNYGGSGTYGPLLTSTTLGQVLVPMTLRARYSSAITLNSGDSLGGAFLYFSEYDYFGTATVTGWTNGPCYVMSYLLYSTNYNLYLTGSTFTYQYKNMKGVVCFTDTAVSTSAAQLTISNSTIPSLWGLTLPGFGGYSQNTGNLVDLVANSMAVPASLQITNSSSVTTPTMGPNLVKSVSKWVIPLPVAIESDVEITMIGDSSANLPFTTSTGTCSVYLAGVKTSVGCIFTTSPTKADYVLTVLQPDLLPTGSLMQLVTYGFNANASYQSITFALKCYSLVTTNTPGNNELIFYANAVPFPYGNGTDLTYIGPSAVTLASFTQTTNNKGAITSFNLSFTVQSKGLYVTNRVRLNLGQYYTENSASQISPTCKIYEYSTTGSTQYSHDWAAIDISRGYNMLDFWPERDLINNNLTYTVKCINFAATTTSSAVGISGKVVNNSDDLTGELSTPASISLATLPSLPKTNQVSASKSFTIPSTFIEIAFTITSPGITTDSIMYIGFPSYYANGLGPDIKCYSATTEIWCQVTERQLMIRYMGTFAEGTSFVITVVGIEQPVNYNSGTFYFVIDEDDNPMTVLSSGTFVDSVSASVLDTQNFPAFQILSMSQTAAYLRQENVGLVLNFYVPSTLNSVTVGQYLFLVFPPNFNDVLRFITPTCQLNIRGNTLKNYISSCTVKGMRLKMPFLDDLTLGSVYSLTVNGLINPINPSSNTFKYVLEITSSTGTSIIARTYSPHANFNMPIFIVNPIRQSLNYYTATDGLITQLSTTANIQSKQVFISPSPNFTTSSYARNVYLSPVNNLYSFPASLNLFSGQNPFPIRLSALTSGVNYIYFSKTGDGSYYSSLPPMVLSINKNYFTPVSFVETQVNIPAAPTNTNYTIGLNLPFDLYPMSQVNLTVTLPLGVGLTLRYNPTIIQFYPDKTSATISMYVNDATVWTQNSTTNMTITPANSNTYAGPAIIPIVATAPVVSSPTLTLAINTTGLKSATFQVSCSEQGRFVYHISREFSYNLTACSLDISSIENWIRQSSISGLRVNEIYYVCEDQLVMANVNSPGVAQTITVANLRASTAYNIEGYCISQIGTTSSISKVSFSTLSNGGYNSKVDFIFASSLTTAQKIKASCALALLFQVNYQKVSTADGYYCSQLLNTRLLQEQSQAQPSRRLLVVPSNRVEMYFGINNDLLSDPSPATINALSINQSQVIAQLANVVGLPALTSITASVQPYTGANDIDSSSINVDVGPNYAYVSGITMPHNGIIYVIIGQNSVWTRDPVISEIKKGSGPNGLPPVYFRVLPYRTAEPYSSYLSYTGVGSENLTMYIMASDDNPFDTANFGAIRSYAISAEVPKWEIFLFMTVAVWWLLFL